jgi:cyclopropane fatty-acyl-phospholipid synthase-like methyltransferase
VAGNALCGNFCYKPDMKQYSEACEQNKEPILAILREAFADTQRVLEIGSGTGQHAVYFARHLPHLSWQTSDMQDSHASIHAWIADNGPGNVLPPLELDVMAAHWPEQRYDGLFSANTTHIMSWSAVVNMFNGIGQLLEPGAMFCLYGPFNYGNRFTSTSNASFDDWLKSRDPASGIRNFEDLAELAERNGMQLEADHEMPVNNRLLVWVKQ